MRLVRRLRHLLHPGRQRELAEEMRFHQEMLARDGAAPARFGNELLLRERSRDAWGWLWAGQFLQDLRLAARQLRRAPGFAILALAILALGIGANTALFSVLNAVLLHPLPYRDAARIVSVSGMPKHPGTVHSFSETARYEPGTTNLAGAGSARRLQAAEVTASFFPLLGTRLRGRNFTEAEQVPGRDGVAIVSDRLARELGGQMLGRSLRFNGRAITVIGIAPPGFDYPEHAQVWLPFPKPWSFAGEKLSNQVIFFNDLARLRPGVSVAQARRELLAIASRPPGNPKEAQQYVEVSLLRSSLIGNAGPMLWMLLAAVGLVLLIACANIANLQLARAVSRRKELALRAALGAGRGRLLRQVLTESLALAVLGGAAGLLLATLATPALRALLPASLPLFAPLALNPQIFLFTAAVALGSGLIFGCAPALQISRAGNARELRRTRAVLASAEVALALMLLVGAGLLLRSFAGLLATDPGFEPQHVLTARLNLGEKEGYDTSVQEARFYAQAVEHVAALPGIRVAAVSSTLPMSPDGRYMRLRLQTREPSSASAAATSGGFFSSVSPEYFRALGVSLLAGRGFSGNDNADAPKVAILNQKLARSLWPNQNPLGKHVALPGNPGTKPVWREVIGVVGNTPIRLGMEPWPFIYLPMAQSASPSAYLVLRTGAATAGLPDAIRRAVAAVNPNEPVSEFATEDALIANSIAAPRFRTLLLGLFAALALLLSAAGLFGAMAYWAARRTAEIGIRMALGAAPGAVLRLVVGQGMKLVAAGIAAGLLGALALSRLLQHFLYRVAPRDPLIFTAAALLMAAVGAVACYAPARRAARTDPLAVLRRE